MVRRIFKNTMVTATAVALVLSVSGAAQAAEVQGAETSGDSEATTITYNNTAVGGIDAAIEAYIASAVTEPEPESEPEAAETEEALTEEAETVASGARYPEFENKLMANVTDYMNIREEASADSELVGKLPQGAIAEVIEQGEEWTKIQSGSVTGYVNNEYVLFGDDAGDYAEENCDKVATVNTTTLKVREEASTDSTCLTMIPEGETYEVLAIQEGWVELLISDDFTGYVSSEFVDVEFDLGTAISKEEEEAEIARQAELERQAATTVTQSTSSSASSSSVSSSNSSSDSVASTGTVSGTRSDVVAYALQFVGNPYVYGGSSLTSGTDCSGFTMSVYAHFGYSLCHSSSGQSGYGTRIGIYEVQPGDLLFYTNGGSSISHVALYIGNGQIVHASTERTGIIVSNAYYQTPCAAVSILP